MEDRVLEGNKEELEVDLWRVLSTIWHKMWLLIVIGIVGAVLSGLGTYFLITPQYQSSALFYVNNSSISVGDTSLDISNGDIIASKALVESYLVILESRTTLNDVIDYAEVDRTYKELRNMISAASVNATEIFEVVVTSPDPEEAEKIANAIAYILPKRISSIIDGTSAKIVDYAIIAATPSSPSYTKNVLLGFLLGVMLVAAVIVLHEIFDITIRSEEDVMQASMHPILVRLPDMAAKSKGVYSSASEGQKKKKKRGIFKKEKDNTFIGSNISFAASEAYKLLRTKVQFSFADENDCHVLGVSSALAGEGKSLSSINLAYSLAQLDKRVLLIDCDMRRPSISKKIGLNGTPGLSNYLTRQINIGEVLQQYKDDGASFYVIAAGTNPPNPIELLSSARMEKAIKAFREYYDYIILDLPPVEEVSDAIVAAKIVDGMLLVVRQDYCNRVAFASTVRQFEFVNARILGVVMNYTTDSGKSYGKKYGKYRKLYRRYRYKYASNTEPHDQA